MVYPHRILAVIAGILVALPHASAVQTAAHAAPAAADGRRLAVGGSPTIAVGGDKLTATSMASCSAHAAAFVKAVRGVVISDASADAHANGKKPMQSTSVASPATTHTVTSTDGSTATARSFCSATAVASTDLSNCRIKCPSSVQLAAQQPWGECSRVALHAC